MKNFVQDGDVLDLTAPAGGVVSGQATLFGDILGVANATAAEGEKVAVSVEKVFDLPKASVAIGEGKKVYWTGTQITTTVGSNRFAGYATKAATAEAATVPVKISN
ncbi:capsid cement protein [Rhizobium rhizogenes]|uniref:DUF2190 family protein n=1 Tax=Rhizobium rhizogenes TaxID=359 RepID=UPI0022C99390|nr:capsid cement protein [Rhizobium rhizogenes]MCZ7480921.1 DUF2190 family protein [Rhizobium rhizogenes]